MKKITLDNAAEAGLNGHKGKKKEKDIKKSQQA